MYTCSMQCFNIKQLYLPFVYEILLMVLLLICPWMCSTILHMSIVWEFILIYSRCLVIICVMCYNFPTIKHLYHIWQHLYFYVAMFLFTHSILTLINASSCLQSQYTCILESFLHDLAACIFSFLVRQTFFYKCLLIFWNIWQTCLVPPWP